MPRHVSGERRQRKYALYAHVSDRTRGRERGCQGWPFRTNHRIRTQYHQTRAAYFSDIDGGRGGYLVINMDAVSQIPAIVEPLFLRLGAIIKIHPVMRAEDMGRANEAFQQVAQKYD